ncbi:Cytochrome p450 [Thalictrum thalictroides]|uniref:Cytochrome p450 n=1 Tax=Thalictrum thalictroides TaxID=46969 RepID=A0A7J6USC7_THATH|nr:Cytochrome p450 [Thalictrum thalictroides]
MNKRCSESKKEAEDVRSLVHEVAELIGTFNLSDYIWFCCNLYLQGLRKRLEDLHVRFDAMAEKIMKEHEEVRDEKKREGTDTSAITTEWALAELINHPNIFEKAREEIDFVVGKSRLVEESDIQKLPYLHAIVKETLRLHPNKSPRVI